MIDQQSALYLIHNSCYPEECCRSSGQGLRRSQVTIYNTLCNMSSQRLGICGSGKQPPFSFPKSRSKSVPSNALLFQLSNVCPRFPQCLPLYPHSSTVVFPRNVSIQFRMMPLTPCGLTWTEIMDLVSPLISAPRLSRSYTRSGG